MKHLIVSGTLVFGLVACGKPYGEYVPATTAGVTQAADAEISGQELTVQDIEELTKKSGTVASSAEDANVPQVDMIPLETVSEQDLDATVSENFKAFEAAPSQAASDKAANKAAMNQLKGQLQDMLKALKAGDKAKVAKLANQINRDMEKQPSFMKKKQNKQHLVAIGDVLKLVTDLIGGVVNLGVGVAGNLIQAILALVF